MAGIITISKGHEASYPWRQIGAAEPAPGATAADKSVGYYPLASGERRRAARYLDRQRSRQPQTATRWHRQA